MSSAQLTRSQSFPLIFFGWTQMQLCVTVKLPSLTTRLLSSKRKAHSGGGVWWLDAGKVQILSLCQSQSSLISNKASVSGGGAYFAISQPVELLVTCGSQNIAQTVSVCIPVCSARVCCRACHLRLFNGPFLCHHFPFFLTSRFVE